MTDKELVFSLIHKMARLLGKMEKVHMGYRAEMDGILRDILLAEQELKQLLKKGETNGFSNKD